MSENNMETIKEENMGNNGNQENQSNRDNGNGTYQYNHDHHKGSLHRDYLESKLWMCPKSPNKAPGKLIGAHYWVEIRQGTGLYQCKFCGRKTRFGYYNQESQEKEVGKSKIEKI